MQRKTPLWKIILTDVAGVICIALVPFLGPLPGPGGIPLLITGLGLLAVNHESARNVLHYVKKHSDSLRTIIFPDVTWIKWTWDAVVLMIMALGTWLNFTAEWWLLKAMSIGIMAAASTLFMMNRNRIGWLDNKLRRQRSK